MILDEAFMRKLERLSLVARRVRAGQVVGERRSTRRGISVEFADYRDYARGDDLRRVDWNIYARLERPFVKLFEEEEDLAVHLLLDASGSMDWGGGDPMTTRPGDHMATRPYDQATMRPRDYATTRPRDRLTTRLHDHLTTRPADQATKWSYARRLAAALGCVALMNGDRLAASNLQSPIAGLHPQFGPVRGRGHVLRLFEWLEGLAAGGTTDLNGGLRAYAVVAGRPGLAVLISDLFSPAGYLEGMTQLLARGYEVTVVHVLAPDEVEPPLGGDLRLVDVETGETQEVTVDGGVRALYRRRLAAWRDDVRSACRARGATYVPVETDVPFERVVLYDLRRVWVVG